jgi:hypothetical protein
LLTSVFSEWNKDGFAVYAYSADAHHGRVMRARRNVVDGVSPNIVR